MENFQAQYIGSKNILVKYQFSNGDIPKVYKESNPGVDFDNRFKTDNLILSIISRVNIMIGWIIKNLPTKVATVVLNIYIYIYIYIYIKP